MADCFSTWGLVPRQFWRNDKVMEPLDVQNWWLSLAHIFTPSEHTFSTPWSSSLIYAKMDFEPASLWWQKWYWDIATCLIKPKQSPACVCLYVWMCACLSVFAGEMPQVDHLVFMVHGIGPVCDFSALEALLNVVSVSHFISWNDLKTIRRTLSLYLKCFHLYTVGWCTVRRSWNDHWAIIICTCFALMTFVI